MKIEPAKALRCAVYTRKSSEEGLDQAFNSLHAQREACEAYIKSQAHEGWGLIATAYDDGGFSGGNMERPGLRRLMADLDLGKIDIVVVYKVDRLTRSLADFAKLVERLDGAKASFVSVTQAFNTTNSMGRLTLNVLLSFAQFEREVTGERIRDKIAASKAKGMWMGGNMPLGYDAPTDHATLALVVNEAEAAQVRLIFQQYLELGCGRALAIWLAQNSIRSKTHVTSRGRKTGGAPFSRGALFYLLKNRTYLGEIPHKGRSYPGAHPGIIDPQTFAEAQALMAAQTRRRSEGPRRVQALALTGILFNADGEAMRPTFAYGRGRRLYRYYVSAPTPWGEVPKQVGRQARRLPAEAIEPVIKGVMERLVRQPGAQNLTPDRVEIHEDELHVCIARTALFAPHGEPARELERLARRLGAAERAVLDEQRPAAVRIILPIRLKLRGGRSWMIAPDGRAAVHAGVDKTLVSALRAAHRLAEQSGLKEGGANLEQRLRPMSTYERRLCGLAFLAPDIQACILAGRQPHSVNLKRLLEASIPPGWTEQRAVWEMLPPAG